MNPISPRFSGAFTNIVLSSRESQDGLTMPQFMKLLDGLDARRAQYSSRYEAAVYEKDGALYGAIAMPDVADQRDLFERLARTVPSLYMYTHGGKSGSLDDYDVPSTRWQVFSPGVGIRSNEAQAAVKATARLYELA